MPIALFALTLSAFAIGTTEFVIVGLVPTIAQDLGVSLPSAGLLVSLYAAGVAVEPHGRLIHVRHIGAAPRWEMLEDAGRGAAVSTVCVVVVALFPGGFGSITADGAR